jgi:hypothetical protein
MTVSNRNRRPWYRDPRWWGAIIAFFALIISVVVWQCQPRQPDFNVSVKPTIGTTYALGSVQTMVTVEGLQGYKYDVILSASEQPQGIVVTFNPLGGPTPTYDSTVTINIASNVPPGDYIITITGTGGDGKEHSCKYVLTVKPTTSTTTSPPPVSTTPTSIQTQTQTPTPQVTVAITEPMDGDTLPWEFTVTGYVENLPSGSSVWVCVYPPNHLFYPQSELHFKPQVVGVPRHEWDVVARVGEGIATNLGDKFDIYTVIANEQATSLLGDYVEEANRTGVWPGMEELPEGADIYTQITVTKFKVINISDAFYPSFWMGDYNSIAFDPNYAGNPYSGPTCTRIIYSAQGSGWAGIYWVYPDDNHGNMQDGQDLTGATKLTFWARGQSGGERVEFKVGGIDGEYPDSIQPAVTTGILILSNEWQQYEIDLSYQDLRHVIGGFFWGASKSDNPYGCTIYLDDIRYE